MKTKWTRIIYIIGVIGLIIGALDPMEGSVVIAVWAGLIALSAYLRHDRHRKIFLISFILITVGVSLLFVISTARFQPIARQSKWWSALILPHPVGWLMYIRLLIIKTINNRTAKKGLKR